VYGGAAPQIRGVGVNQEPQTLPALRAERRRLLRERDRLGAELDALREERRRLLLLLWARLCAGEG
jgi:hypothetical protein